MRRASNIAAALAALSALAGIAIAQTAPDSQRSTASSHRMRDLPVASEKTTPPISRETSSDPQEGGEIAPPPANIQTRRHIGNAKFDNTTIAPPPRGVRPAGPARPVIAATSSIKCGDTTYQVSVEGGECSRAGTGDSAVVDCRNQSGDRARATCAAGCGDTTGNGSCTIAAPD